MDLEIQIRMEITFGDIVEELSDSDEIIVIEELSDSEEMVGELTFILVTFICKSSNTFAISIFNSQ